MIAMAIADMLDLLQRDSEPFVPVQGRDSKNWGVIEEAVYDGSFGFGSVLYS